jgi:octaprenyl-diphosphate synthase
MSEINKIKAFIEPEIKAFESYFKNAVKTKVALLDIVTNYIIRRKGKQIRPMLVFLSAKITGKVNESTYVAATLIELLHTASLVHDDVVDDAEKRRGFFSVNALWKSKVAVLTGDFFLSKGLLTAIQNKEYKLLEIVSDAVKQMAEGELLQIEKSGKLNITEEIYFDIITKKTASLIASCTATGAKSSGADDVVVEDFKLFGEYAGIAFQIKDDLFDYEKTNLTGKPSGNDIKEKKMTLPLIYAINQCDYSERRKILKIVGNSKKNNDKVLQVVNFVKDKGGLEYSENKMNEYKQKALDILNKYPSSEAKTNLSALVNYIAVRNN